MASSTRPCATNKCEISSCAVCHCCEKNLCLDHLKEHKDQLNAKLGPLANHINTFLDDLEHFSATSLPSFKLLEQWCVEAHQTVDLFHERMRHKLFEEKKLKPQKKLNETRDILDQLIRKQGATRENIDALTIDIRSIKEEINDLQNIHINLRPLVIDENLIIAPISSKGKQKRNTSRSEQSASQNELLQPAPGAAGDLYELGNGVAFQIFVQLYTGKQILLAVKPTDTILELKNKIQDREGLPVDQQRLSYMGKTLADGYTLATYDIQRQCTISAILATRNPS